MNDANQNVLKCFKCQRVLELRPEQKITRQEECSACYSSIHSCKMCKFYDPTSYNQCRESNADRVVEKDAANYCDYFVLGNPGTGLKSKDDILAKANSLFKN